MLKGFFVSPGHQREVDTFLVLGTNVLNEIPVILCLCSRCLVLTEVTERIQLISKDESQVLTQQPGAAFAFIFGVSTLVTNAACARLKRVGNTIYATF